MRPDPSFRIRILDEDDKVLSDTGWRTPKGRDDTFIGRLIKRLWWIKHGLWWRWAQWRGYCRPDDGT